jgi:hypothetical protein
MTDKKPKRPRDTNQLAKMVIDIATGEVEESKADANARGVAGGKVGGAARAKALSPERKREIAKKAAASRWKDAARSD